VVLSDSCGAAWALADPAAWHGSCGILLDNALRVAPAGQPDLGGTGHAPSPSLTVRDQGRECLPTKRSLIFEASSADGTLVARPGFGLGPRPSDASLARRMHGSLTLVETEGPGATFTVTLAPAQAPVEEGLPAAIPG